MPLTKIEENNAMIVEGDDGIFYPKILNYGQVQVFFGNKKLHGPPVKNISKITRFTMDFRCLFANQYDESILTDKLILSRVNVPQKKYFTRNSTMTSDLFIIVETVFQNINQIRYI